MASEKAAKEREDFTKLQAKITKQWQTFATTFGREAYDDLMKYIDSQRELYRQYGEDMAMPHPLKSDEKVSINAETISALLQNGRGMHIIKTYITNRANAGDVVQPKKTKQ
jgi:hypothetical protein